MPQVVEAKKRPYTVVDLTALDETDDASSGAKRADADNVVVAVDVTTFSGNTETLNLEVEWSPDGTSFASASTPDTIAEITAVGQFFGRFSTKAPFWRLAYTIGGTTVVLDFKAVAINVG